MQKLEKERQAILARPTAEELAELFRIHRQLGSIEKQQELYYKFPVLLIILDKHLEDISQRVNHAYRKDLAVEEVKTTHQILARTIRERLRITKIRQAYFKTRQ